MPTIPQRRRLGFAGIATVLCVLAVSVQARSTKSFLLVDERCMVMSPDITPKYRNITTFPGSKTRSVCAFDGKTVKCVSRPLKAGATMLGGRKTTRTTFHVPISDSELLIAQSESASGSSWLTVDWKHSDFHWADTSLTPKGVLQKQCAGSVLGPVTKENPSPSFFKEDL